MMVEWLDNLLGVAEFILVMISLCAVSLAK